MAIGAAVHATNSESRSPHPVYRPGDYVTTVTGYPVLYEILSAERDGLIRVRGVNWAPGYSAVVGVQEIRPVTHILSQ